MATTVNPAGTAQSALPLAFERLGFKRLMLANPNYFGTAPGFGTIVTSLQGSTVYEQLACVGLNPGVGFFAEGTIEAVIEVKQANGFVSGPCGTGSIEYVRFYVQAGNGWTDVGVASTNVYNLAGSAFPVSYAVSIPLSAVKRFCWSENVVTVRAILSWEVEPPANTPNYVPVWGNHVDARVQIAPASLWEIPIVTLAAEGLLKLDAKIAASVDPAASLPAKVPVPLDAASLAKLYAGTKVPSHRWGFAAAKTLLAKPLSQSLKLTATTGLDLGAILAGLEATSGDTYYEQLTCAGYDPQNRLLEAVITIKQDAGYSGSLCTAGSTEYVAFYGWYGGVWNALGTATVNVHDLQTIAAGNPVNYAVIRLSPVETVPCEQLTSIPLRAILSWQEAPTGPEFVPVWGNVLDTHIQPQIGSSQQGDHARLMRIGDVSIIGITSHGGEYLADATGVAGDCPNADDSPFGGEIVIEGDVTPKVDGIFDLVTGALLPGTHPIVYQAWVTYPGGTKLQLTNPFDIEVYPPSAPMLDPSVTVLQFAQAVPGGATGQLYYIYRETDTQAVDPRTLAVFQADGLAEGNYTVEIDALLWDGSAYVPLPAVSQTFYVYNGAASGDGAPVLSLTLTSAADCGNVGVGAVLEGEFSVSDDFFGSLSIALTPVSIDNVPVTLPAIELFDASNTALPNPVYYNGSNGGGVSGTFRVNTAGMPTCGYTIQAIAADRALVNSVCDNHWSEEAVGFCLVADVIS